MSGYRWFRAGDLNAFFALMFDNVANLVILASLLIGAFHFPKDIVLYRMVPGTAVGVLVGDLIYAWLAGRLGRRSGGETTPPPCRSASTPRASSGCRSPCSARRTC